MADQAISTYTPLDVPLPPAPATSYFTAQQWKALYALADAIIPSIRTASTSRGSNDTVVSQDQWNTAISKLTATSPSPEAVKIAAQYLEEDASSNLAFRACIERIFGDFMHDEGRSSFGLMLNALNTRAGLLIMTGSTTPIHQHSVTVRERIISAWDTSRLASFRATYRVLIAIVKRSWVLSSPTINAVLGFPRVPIHGKPAMGFRHEFLQLPPSNEPGNPPETITTDVIVIGSGCGGAMAAKNLAEAGYRVLVVEKSYSYTSDTFPMGPNEGFVNMFEGGGAVLSNDGSVAILAGSTWGGGGTVNWSAALQTQAYVRQEWADNGLPFFTSLRFQRSLDRVCDRIGVTEHVCHNRQNNAILDGARRLGYAAKPVPQNTGGEEHYCGYCMLGCNSAAKKGPAETCLVDAANAGAIFMEGFRADRVLFTETNDERVASGVEGTWTSRDSYLGLSGEGAIRRKVIIHAKKVVVASGALQSPLLLLRSGLDNPQIGRNLHLHPVLACGAVYEEETRPWEGAALTTVVNEFENLDGRGHGVKIETSAMVPSLIIPVFPWRGGLDYKLFAASINHSTSFITLARDRDSGRLYPDPTDGRVRAEYTVSSFDLRHIVEGVIACAKIAYITGAKEFHTASREIPPFIRPAFNPKGTSDSQLEEQDLQGINNPALQSWIAEVRRKSLQSQQASFVSAHQMGTCRMGSSAKSSVVDPTCQVWGTEGLHVMDASVFPSASGANPMVTVMAIADWASQEMAWNLKKSENVMARL
ncbi:hypothetical protein N7532_005407 [Penicillium argentinense]|uniref:Long-chain-alcohol oxidase n=1 Tax=Penicillium argentinense TaxID=1131581 RepID=A0A9W9FDU8_9EURO|nr:uncharacterized protein N7532_005407 [Penicillium argentinense]KAJ5098406.1 hypothetical protein N7532_005407 [Penicillium argentinense]